MHYRHNTKSNFSSAFLGPKLDLMEGVIRRDVFVASVLSEIWTPKESPALGLFFVVSAYAQTSRSCQSKHLLLLPSLTPVLLRQLLDA